MLGRGREGSWPVVVALNPQPGTRTVYCRTAASLFRLLCRHRVPNLSGGWDCCRVFGPWAPAGAVAVIVEPWLVHRWQREHLAHVVRALRQVAAVRQVLVYTCVGQGGADPRGVEGQAQRM